MTKPGIVNRVLVSLFSGSIALFILFAAYYRKGIKLVLLASLILHLIIILKEKKSKILVFFTQKIPFRYAPFIFFGLSAFISLILSQDFLHSRHIFIERYILYFLVFEIGRRLFVSKTVFFVFDESFGINIFEFMKYIFLFAGFLMGIGGVIDYFRFHPERLFSVLGHQVTLTRYITFFFPIVYCFIFKGNTLTQRIFAILTSTMLLMCMVFNGARAVWIAGAISIFFASELINKKHIKYFIPGFIIFLFLVKFFVPIRLSNFDTWFFRKDVILAGINIFRDHIFFGAGPGMFEQFVSNYTKSNVIIHAHNMYLEILAELGIAGLAAFLMIFIVFYSRVSKKLSIIMGSPSKFLYIGLLASNISLLILAFFSSVIMFDFKDAPMFWLIFGMLFGLESAQFGNTSLKRERISDV